MVCTADHLVRTLASAAMMMEHRTDGASRNWTFCAPRVAHRRDDR